MPAASVRPPFGEVLMKTWSKGSPARNVRDSLIMEPVRIGPPHRPGDCSRGTMPFDFDVIVIGSGAGGATFAYACAAAKKSVLLVERGGKQEAHACHDELATLI